MICRPSDLSGSTEIERERESEKECVNIEALQELFILRPCFLLQRSFNIYISLVVKHIQIRCGVPMSAYFILVPSGREETTSTNGGWVLILFEELVDSLM